MAPREALVVDDDRDTRDALAQLLSARGYTVRQADNGKTALDMIAERLPAVMLLDLEMPVMSGWEVLASLQRANALHAITIVVLSAGAQPPLDVAFIRKPCTFHELLRMLRDAGRSHQADASSPTEHL